MCGCNLVVLEKKRIVKTHYVVFFLPEKPTINDRLFTCLMRPYCICTVCVWTHSFIFVYPYFSRVNFLARSMRLVTVNFFMIGSERTKQVFLSSHLTPCLCIAQSSLNASFIVPYKKKTPIIKKLMQKKLEART